MKRLVFSSLVGLIALAACTQTPVQPTLPPKQTLGMVRVEFQLGANGLTSSVKEAPRATTQALTGIGTGGIQMRLLSTGTFTTGTRGSGGERWVSVTYDIRNARMDAGNTAYTVANSNVTFLATGTAGVLGDSAIADMQSYGGTSLTGSSLAQSFKPTHGARFNAVTGTPETNPGTEDFQAFDEVEVSGFATGSLIPMTYGFVARRSSANPTNRTLGANPSANQFDGRVTFAMRFPLQATVGDDPFTFAMNFLVVTDDQTRVTQSLEQISDNTVPSQATQLTGAVVNTLPGSTYNATATRALPSVRIARAPTNNPVYLVQGAGSLSVTTNADSGAGSLRQALSDIAPGGTVELQGIDGQTITLSSTLVLSKNVTIQNLSATAQSVTIRGGANPNASTNVRLFQVQSGVTATLNNVRLSNGYASGAPARGGAILNSGTLTLTNVILSNNTARGSDGGSGSSGSAGGPGGAAQGGAVYNAGVLTATSTTFTGNTANGGNGGNGGAGAILPGAGLGPGGAGGAGGNAWGGALYNAVGAVLNLTGTLDSNIVTGGSGGNSGMGMMMANGGNGGSANGGAIYKDGGTPTLSVTYGTSPNNNQVFGGTGGVGMPIGVIGAAFNPNINP
jgi:hypothetical protein